MYFGTIVDPNGKLLAIGGIDKSEEVLNTIEAYDEEENIWEVVQARGDAGLSKRFSHNLISCSTM